MNNSNFADSVSKVDAGNVWSMLLNLILKIDVVGARILGYQCRASGVNAIAPL
jgi:hypothetical protein